VSLRVLIVDDEPLAREKLRTLLANEADIEVLGECPDGARALEAIEAHAPDLVFLDVQMPEVDGFAVLDAIDPERMPAVVFVTAYDQYALKAFEVHALDYLLKPFDRGRFHSALDRARSEIARRADAAAAQRRLHALLDGLGRRRHDRLIVRESGRVYFVRADEIDWIESAGNYARIHVGGRSHLLRETMKALADRLDPAEFVRIHRGTIVRIDRIRRLESGPHGEYVVVLADATQLTSSRSYSEELQRLITGR